MPMKKMTLHFMRILASAFIGLTMTAGCLSVEPYHIRARKVAKLERGMELDVARRKLAEGLRHLFTVRRSGSEWTLCSVLIDTGWNPIGLRYGVLFRDRKMQKLVDYKRTARFAEVPTKWHVVAGKRRPLSYGNVPWPPTDYTYVDRIIAAPDLPMDDFWRRVGECEERSGFTLRGDPVLTLVIMPLAILEYPRTLKYRRIHAAAERELSGFRLPIGDRVDSLGDLDRYLIGTRRIGNLEVRKYGLKDGRMFLRPYESARSLVLIVKDGKIDAIYNEDAYTDGFISPSWVKGMEI